MAVINVYGAYGCTLYLLLTITEIIVLKVIYINKFSTIAMVNEYFLKKVLILSNFTVIGVYILILLSLREYETSSHPIISCIQSQSPLNQLIERQDVHEDARL